MYLWVKVLTTGKENRPIFSSIFICHSGTPRLHGHICGLTAICKQVDKASVELSKTVGEGNIILHKFITLTSSKVWKSVLNKQLMFDLLLGLLLHLFVS